MVAVISVDAYPFFWFLRPVTLRIQGSVFSGCTDPSDSKKTKLRSCDQEAFPLAGKNTRIVLVACFTRKCIPTAICDAVDISEVLWCHLLRQISSQ